MLERLLGQETEYAIRAAPIPGYSRPSNLTIYDAIIAAIATRVQSRPGNKLGGMSSLFVENGGSFCYEFVPSELHGGLFEASTPECRGPGQLLLYQKAQEELLLDALDEAAVNVSADGVEDLGLLKNCRDVEGRTYGAQENYEADIAKGIALLCYRLGLVALVPFVLLFMLLTWTLVVAIIVIGIALLPFLLALVMAEQFVPRLKPVMEALLGDRGVLERALFHLTWLDQLVAWPIGTLFSLLLRVTAFRRIRRGTTAFFASRCVVTGAGSVEEDGRYVLSEKGPALRRTMRSTGGSQSRSIFDTGNLLKGLMIPAAFRLAPFFDLFRARQRLQIGMSDSNMAQVSEYLKLGMTCLVIDMAEEGWLDDAPRLARPVKAVRAFVADPTLQVRERLRRRRGEMSALELQRWYLEKARGYLKESAATSLEAREVVRLWSECLDALSEDPGTLVGRVDWVTKRWMLEETAAESPLSVRKKVDIGYHELGRGYFARLEREDLAPRMVTPDEAREAIRRPPQDTPARLRSRLIRELAGEGKVTVDWGSVRIGGRFRGKVVRLDDYRR